MRRISKAALGAALCVSLASYGGLPAHATPRAPETVSIAAPAHDESFCAVALSTALMGLGAGALAALAVATGGGYVIIAGYAVTGAELASAATIVGRGRPCWLGQLQHLLDRSFTMDPATICFIIAIVAPLSFIILLAILVPRWDRKNKEAHPELKDLKGFQIRRDIRRKK